MNKSILLVVCDFLVLSLLSFVSFDAVADEGDTISAAALEEAKSQSQSEVGLLFEILNKKNEEQQRENEEQSKKHESESEALAKALAEKEDNLDQRLAELEKTRQDLENSEETAANLAQQKAELEKERANLQKEKGKLKEERDILTGQTKEAADTRAALIKEVKDLESKKAVVGERLKNMHNEVEKKKAELSQSEKELAQLDKQLDEQKDAAMKERQQLQVELAQKDATLGATQGVLADTKNNLATAQGSIETLRGDKVQLQGDKARLQGNLAQSEAEKAFIAQQKAALEEETSELEKQAQTLLATKNQLEQDKTGLQNEKRDLQTNLEKSRLQIEAAKKEEERIRQSILAAKADLERQRQEAAAELARQEAEKKRLLDEKARIMENNRKLTENVATLAELSEQKTEEIKNKIDKSQPLSPNTIFTHFRNAQVRLRFVSVTKGLLRSTQTREYNVQATLVEDASGVYAVTLTRDTPFETRRARAALQLTGSVALAGKNIPVSEIGYSKADPRVLLIPVPAAAAAGQHRFKIDADPYHFPKAILVDPSGDGYGEMGFNIHAGNDQYIELKSGLFRSLSGEFTQSTGDIAFSQTGHFLGLLVNRNHAIRLPDLGSPYKISLGTGFSAERASILANILDRKVRVLNSELH